jgi:hypothetical protein
MSYPENIKQVMTKHLREKGYPNMSNIQILGELRPMWIKLEEAGLIQPGMTFAAFKDHAEAQFLFAELRAEIGL